MSYFTCNSSGSWCSITCVWRRAMLHSRDCSACLLIPTTTTKCTSPKNKTVNSDLIFTSIYMKSHKWQNNNQIIKSLNKELLHNSIKLVSIILIFLQMAENISPISTMTRSPFISSDLMIIICHFVWFWSVQSTTVWLWHSASWTASRKCPQFAKTLKTLK